MNFCFKKTTLALTWVALLFLCFRLPLYGQDPGSKPDLTLHGTVTPAHAQTYLEIPFAVPDGVTRLTVNFSYTERDKHTSIDLGVLDAERFRGWSGGNKSGFTISETDATPSYLPGPVRAGMWKLLLGVPNIQAGVTSRYEANIYFGHRGDVPRVSTFSTQPLRTGAAWFRGDFHMHDAHSDGSCVSQSGLKVPCPVYRTVQMAAERKLDFIAISDHNTGSQYDAIRELQPYFDHILLLPAREITTFYGHANVFGTTDFIDFRVGSKAVPDISTVEQQAASLHGLFSINHPGLDSGAACMGCGWTAPNTDYRMVTAVEAINGGPMDGPGNGIAFWEDKLNRGFRITAIGGSDNHDADIPATQRSAIGHPATAVFAANLSERAILDGVRAGHVFIDLDGSGDRVLQFTAKTSSQTVSMGDAMQLSAGETVHFSVQTEHLPSGTFSEMVQDGNSRRLDGPGFEFRSDGQRHWFRLNVRGSDGHILLLGNPIYLNFGE